MAKSKRVKRVYICPTCKGNGYVKVACIYEKVTTAAAATAAAAVAVAAATAAAGCGSC